MKPTKGINRDVNPIDQPQGTYAHSKNIVLTELQGSVENEQGTVELSTVAGLTTIGKLVAQEVIILFGIGASGSEIGEVDKDGNYTTLLTDADLAGGSLGFSQDFPIKAEYYVNVFGERVVAFTDDFNKPRVINIDNIPNDIQDTLAFPEANQAGPAVQLFRTGGRLLSGVWFFVYRYENADGTSTDWSATAGPAYVSSEVDQGSPGGIASTYQAKVEIFPVDTTYDFVRVGAIHIANGVLNSGQYGRIPNQPIDFGRILFVANGQDFETSFGDSTTEFFSPTANYIRAKAISQLNNRLYFGNVETDEAIDFSAAALNVQLKWVAVVASRGDDDAIDLSMMPSEVYAMYMAFQLKAGGLSRAFHIPGRAAGTFPAQGDNDFDFAFQERPIGFTIEGSPRSPFVATGQFALWENVDEQYPNVEPYISAGLAGQNVRHHRMIDEQDSLSFPARNNQTIAKENFRYGISVENVVIPQEIADKVSGYYILFVPHDIANALEPVRGIPFLFGEDVDVSSPTPGDYKPTAGWWSVDKEQSDELAQFDSLFASSRHFTMQPLSLLDSRPNVEAAYIRSKITLSTSNPPRQVSAVHRNETPNSADRYFYKYNRTLPGDWANPVAFPNPILGYTRITDEFYIPNGGILTDSDGDTINNVAGPTGLFVKAAANLPFFNPVNQRATDNVTEVPFISLRSSVENVFVPFTNQPLAFFSQPSTFDQNSGFVAITGAGTVPKAYIMGGDAHVNVYSQNSTGPAEGEFAVFNNDTENGTNFGEGNKTVVEIYAHDWINFYWRQIDNADPQTFWFGPKSNIFGGTPEDWYVYEQDIFQPYNILYNTDHNRKNDFVVVPSIFNALGIQTEFNFPFSIVYSDLQGTESPLVLWKSWPALNRFTQPGNRGEIINLQGVGNQRLYIHHEDSLFITRDRATLATDAESVTVGSSEIFGITPYELISTQQGYAGTKDMFSCILTPYGYSFFDRDKGRLMLHDGKELREISGDGLRIFFRDNAPQGGDNPFILDGISGWYDYRQSRLLYTVHNAPIPYTVSYVPGSKAMVSFHDYRPEWVDTLNNQVMIAGRRVSGDAQFSRMNEGPRGVFFGTTFPSFIDIVFNADNYNVKILQGVEWKDTSLNDLTEDYFDTFTHVTIWNESKTSGRIAMEQFQSLANPGNLRRLEKTWFFNAFKNLYDGTSNILTRFDQDYTPNQGAVAPFDWTKQQRMQDNWFYVRLEYDNAQDRKVVLSNVDFKARGSVR